MSTDDENPAPTTLTFVKPQSTAVTFSLDEGATEILRFEPGGKVFVRGEQVDDNPAVYEALRQRMAGASVMPR